MRYNTEDETPLEKRDWFDSILSVFEESLSLSNNSQALHLDVLLMDIEACTPFVKNLHLVSPYEVFLQRLSLSSGMLQHGCVWTKIHISRAAHENFLPVSATMGGSCTHPDQSRGLALVHNDASDLWVGVSKPILSFFILGGAALT